MDSAKVVSRRLVAQVSFYVSFEIHTVGERGKSQGKKPFNQKRFSFPSFVGDRETPFQRVPDTKRLYAPQYYNTLVGTTVVMIGCDEDPTGLVRFASTI